MPETQPVTAVTLLSFLHQEYASTGHAHSIADAPGDAAPVLCTVQHSATGSATRRRIPTPWPYGPAWPPCCLCQDPPKYIWACPSKPPRILLPPVQQTSPLRVNATMRFSLLRLRLMILPFPVSNTLPHPKCSQRQGFCRIIPLSDTCCKMHP